MKSSANFAAITNVLIVVVVVIVIAMDNKVVQGRFLLANIFIRLFESYYGDFGIWT